MSASSIVTHIDQKLDKGECQLIGPENILIPEGTYQASYLHFETCAMYSRKIIGNKNMRDGGKLYLWFWIDPYEEKLDRDSRIELYISYNTSSLILPVGKGGKFVI